MTDLSRRARSALPYLVFAAVCYVPLLLTRPGWLSADTKSYLYIDPDRLMSRAWSMWDPQVGLGTVSHQTVGYLWPMGPWYWVFERLGVPDWVAQRLWWGTLLFLAGLGVVYLLRRFEWPPEAIWPAAFVYAFTPFVLTHIGRLSAVLMPYVGLGWLIGLTIASLRTRSWRHPALFALVVATVGSINLTALALAGLGPLAWIGYVLATRQESPMVVAKVVGRIGLLTTAASAWWLAGLTVQASHGIDIVRYTEGAEVVARTSTAFEVMRGLGYWFFYGGDKLQLWLEVSYEYTQRPWLIAVTFAIPILALAGVAAGRWRHQAYFVILVLLGAIVAIGAHPWDQSTPFGAAVQWFVGTERGLAFRSLPRVSPLVALGTAVLLGGAVGALLGRAHRVATGVAVGACLLAVIALAPLWQRTLVSDNLSRQEIPGYWLDAAAAIDEADDGTRVLELPGSDFASYRWGMTVDPITPGLTDRPYVARELVPHGTPMAADLVNSLDLRIQENTLEPASLAPIARLLRVGDIVVRSDLEFERHNTARPRIVWDLLRTSPGLGSAEWFGEPTPNIAGPILQHLDEQWLLYEGALPDPPPVAMFPVRDPVPIVSTKPAEAPVLLSGDGAGIVDAAAVGVIDGSELVRYTAELTEDEIRSELAGGATLVVTDSNRKRGERWGTLRHNRGHTERIDEERLAHDPGDNRLPRFPGAPASAQTVTIQRGGITADATGYGNPITYAGEERAARAVDGDTRTAWSVGVFSDARGERLLLGLDEPLALDWIRLQQMSPDDTNRVVTLIRLTFDGVDHLEVDLDPTSWEAPGQVIEFPERVVEQVEVTLLADTAGDPPRFREFGPLGIVELVLGPDSPLIDEIVAMPTDALDAAGSSLANASLALVMSRIRQDPTDRTREDEERAIRRQIELPAERRATLNGIVRLSARADDDVLDQLLGHRSDWVTVSASDRMDGSRVERAAAALDGDLGTAWTTPWGQPINHTLRIEADAEQRFDEVSVHLVTDGRHSVPSRLRLSVDGVEVTVADLPELADVDVPGHTSVVTVAIPPTMGRVLEIEVLAAREVVSIDWTAGRPLAHPIAIAEVEAAGLSVGPPPEMFDTGCRDDLLTIAGAGVSIRVQGRTDDALAGRRLDLTMCDDHVVLPSGIVEVLAAPGVDTGLDFDTLVLRSDGPSTALRPSSTAAAEIVSQQPDRMTVQIADAEAGRALWFVLGQSHTDGWVATIDGVDLGPSRLVDGYANGWLITPSGTEAVVELRFAPQQRVNLGMAASVFAVLACIALAIVDRRRDRPQHLVPAPIDRTLLRFEGAQPSWRTTGMLVGATAVLTSLFAPLVVAGLLAAVAGLGSRHRAARPAIALLPAALLGLAGLYVVVWQIRHSIEPGIEWVTELERAHPIALAGILALGVHLAVSWVWAPRPGWDSTDTAN